MGFLTLVGPLDVERSSKTADLCFTRLPGLSGGGGGGRIGCGYFGALDGLVSGGDAEISGDSEGSSETEEGQVLAALDRGGLNSGFTGAEAGRLAVLSGLRDGLDTSSSVCVSPEVLAGL